MLRKLLFLGTYFILLFVGIRFIEIFLNIITCYECKDAFQFMTKYISKWKYFLGDNNLNRYDDGTIKTYTDDQEVENKHEEASSNEVLLSYGDLMENVDDTKASVWVIKVFSMKNSNHFIKKKEWRQLSVRLKGYGIKTAVYKCKLDPRLCLIHNIHKSTILLTLPKGSSAKGDVNFHIFDGITSGIMNSTQNVYSWIQGRLYARVKRLHSFSELSNRVSSRASQFHKIEPSVSFIYQTNQETPPLILTSLSVRFTGRIKFYLLKSKDLNKKGNVYAMNHNFRYNYGNHKGESFNYSCIELFLKTLHPEVNDVFVISVVLLNMACWLELFLQKGGPIKRVLYYIWGFMITNVVLLFIWLPLIQLLCLPQMQPFLRLVLTNLQKIMFTDIAALIRQDFLQMSQHLPIVFAGFICYGVFLGYIRYRLGGEYEEWSSFRYILEDDIRELSETVHSLMAFMTPTLQIYRFEEQIERILHRVMMQDLRLHDHNPNDYIQELPIWNICSCKVNQNNNDMVYTENEISSASEDDGNTCKEKSDDIIPSYMISSGDCVICLRTYKCKDRLMGISCGHCFHRVCLEAWLLSPNSQQRCPICRWPADVTKGDCDVIDLRE